MTDKPLRELLAFDARVQREREQSPAFLHRRDRRFALECAERGSDPSPAHWLRHLAAIGRLPGTDPAPANDALWPWHRVQFLLMGIGLVLGALCVYGLLVYEGTERVNLTLIIALVALQVFLALLTALQSIVGWQPLRPLMTRCLRGAPASAMLQLQPLLLARAAQLGGLGFGVGGLAVLLGMILIQDLAFGWSTTLTTGSQAYHQFVLSLSWPWHALWPAAVPDLSLVETTRFFRVQGAHSAPATGPQRWGDWWPFVVALWTCYVISPRAVLALLAHGQLNWRARQALRQHPGFLALQARMHTPVVDTSEATSPNQSMQDAAEPGVEFVPLPQPTAILCWAGAGEPTLPAPIAELQTTALRAGGSASLAEDAQAIAAVGRQLELAPAGERTVALLVRAWEPPTGELADVIRQARGAWPIDSTLVLALEPLHDAASLPLSMRTQWQHFAARFTDDPPLLALLEPGNTDAQPQHMASNV